MKAVVNTFLNIRTGLPIINPENNLGFYDPGDEVEIVDMHIGEMYKQSNVWYQLVNGGFVWSGGVTINMLSPIAFDRNKDVTFWLQHFGLNDIQSKRGEGVKVAILDSGINLEHSDFSGLKKKCFDFVNPDGNCNDQDGHGSHCAGILAAQGNKKIEGVAPFCELLVAKVLLQKRSLPPLDNSWFKNGLEWACKNADVISISMGISDRLWDASYERMIDDAVNNGKVIVCSIGNIAQNKALNPGGDYPARYRNCISVGALDFDFQLSALTKKFDKLDICIPGEFITSTYNGGNLNYREDSGTSMATPFMAGLIAIKKQMDNRFNLEDSRAFIKQITEVKNLDGFKYVAIQNGKIQL